MKVTYYNYKKIVRNLTKDVKLTRTELELLYGVFFWAIHNNTIHRTVSVIGKTRTVLKNIMYKTKLITTYDDEPYLGAKLVGDYELDNTWIN